MFSRPLTDPGFCEGWEALVLGLTCLGLRISLFDFCPLDIGFSNRGGRPRTDIGAFSGKRA